MFVCLLASLETARPNFTYFFVCVCCLRPWLGTPLRWDTLCTSGFVDIVMFSYNTSMAHRDIVYS